jgi:DNA transformation protein
MTDFQAFVDELLAGFGPVRFKRMFGVVGLFAGDVIFGLIDDEAIYLRVDEALRAELEAEGSAPWVYRHRTAPRAVSPYWRLPEAALDDPDAAAAWARKALGVVEAKAAGKKPRRRNP